MSKIIIGEVVSVLDTSDGDRIKVRIMPEDNGKNIKDIPFAFPLLPKMIHIKPKVGEAVTVICNNDNPFNQRYYIAPVISQPQQMYKSVYGEGATNLLNGGVYKEYQSQKNSDSTKGCYLKDDEVGLLGRKNTQIILSDNDIRIRCGVSNLDPSTKEIGFNKISPAFIKLKYYENGKSLNNGKVNSVATIVADEINLISNNGTPYYKTHDTEESISDETIKNMIETAHLLPYGDALCDFLTKFLQIFKTHVHNYGPVPPDLSMYGQDFFNTYGTNDKMKNEILSKHIRIN